MKKESSIARFAYEEKRAGIGDEWDEWDERDERDERGERVAAIAHKP